MSFFHSLLSQVGGTADTTINGEQFFLVVGDSIAQGSNNSSGPGPTPTAGTVKQYNGSAIVDIGSADVYNVVSGGGTMMPKMGIDYNAESGKIPMFISCGSQGSNFENETGDGGNNWSSAGTLRGTTEADVSAALALKGLTKLKGICVILGVNSARGTEDLTTVVYPAIDAFFTWLTSTYPGVPIMVSQVGRSEVQSHDARLYGVRNRILSNAFSTSDVHMVFNMASWINTSGYGVDNLHPNQVGQDNMGASFARWLRADNSSYSKWGRSVIASLYDNPSTTRRGLINTFIASQVTSGNFALLEHLTVYKTTTQDNCFSDFAFLGYLFNNTSIVFTANDSLSSNGTSNHYAITFIGSVNNARASQNDFIVGVKCKVNSTAQGTVSCLFGGSDGSDVLGTLQNSTPALTYRSSDATINTNTTDLKYANDSMYGVARNGTTKALIKNASVLASVTQASTGTVSVLPTVGAFNNNGTIQNRINATYEYSFAAKYSTFDLSGFITDIEALLDNW